MEKSLVSLSYFISLVGLFCQLSSHAREMSNAFLDFNPVFESIKSQKVSVTFVCIEKESV